MSMNASELKSLARDQIWGHNDFFGVWQRDESLLEAAVHIVEFFEGEGAGDDEPAAVLVVGHGVIMDILLEDAKLEFDKNGDEALTEHQLQALLVNEIITAAELGEYLDPWVLGHWSAAFEAKYRLKGKALFDFNGTEEVPEVQLQALLDEKQITADELAEYMSCWGSGRWSAEFEAKHRAKAEEAAAA